MCYTLKMTGFLFVVLILNGYANTEVVNETQGPLTQFGVAAIRAAAANATLGRITVSVTRDLKPESFRIRKTAPGYQVSGGDARGAMYGALDFAEQIELSGKVREKTEQPSLAMRALKFNIPLPGTGYLSEEDLANNQWFWSVDYWSKFLDMAARNRYNAITF